MSISRPLVRVKERPSDRFRQFVENQLRTKAWAPGELLPAETALAEQFKLHRLTVNKILASFVQEGHLVRKPGIGTVVAEGSVRKKELGQTIALITSHSF